MAIGPLLMQVSVLQRRYNMPFIIPPSEALVDRFLLSVNPLAVSQMCGILAQYGKEYEALRSQEPVLDPERSGFNNITVLHLRLLECRCSMSVVNRHLLTGLRLHSNRH